MRCAETDQIASEIFQLSQLHRRRVAVLVGAVRIGVLDIAALYVDLGKRCVAW